MTSPLSVLIVEDSESDADLILRQLRTSGFDVTHVRVETGPQMREALENPAWDMVICDFDLTGFDAADALVALRESGRDIPLIIVSGAIGEDTAIGMLRAGASDYVLKDDLARLGPTVKRELAGRIRRLEREREQQALRSEERQVRATTERNQSEKALLRHIEEGERARAALLGVLEDQREVEESLRESEKRFRTMLDQNVSAMFVVEGDRFTYANQRAGEILGIPPEELVGKEVKDVIAESDLPSVMQAFQELLSGERDKVERSFTARRQDGTLADIGASATLTVLDGRSVILGSAQDIGERKRAQREIDRYIASLENTMQGTLEAVSAMVELRDPYTAGHERRVGDLAAAIGGEMGLSDHVVKGLRLTGLVHDIGKISVPAELLSKPSRLSAMEYELIKGHSQAGYDVLKHVDFPWPVAEVILQHHERLDGSGYPRGLRGGEILLESRIMAVADVVEAMSSHRPYRPGLGLEAALAEIEKNTGRFYDPGVAAACLRLFRERRYTFPD